MKAGVGVAIVLSLLILTGMRVDEAEPGQVGKSQAPPREFLYVGTSNNRDSEGLNVYEFKRDGATLEHIQTVRDRRGPSFQALHPNRRILYSVSSHRFIEGGDLGTLSAYRIDAETGMLTLFSEQPTRGRAHLSVDPQGRFVYVSDYGGGRLSVHGITSDGGLTEALDVVEHTGSSVNPERQTKPYVHSVVPSVDGRFVYASDLGVDKIFIYGVAGETGELTPATVPHVATTPGSGPRHAVVSADGRFLYSVEEMHHAVAAYAIDPEIGELSPIQRLDLLPADFDPTVYVSGADIHISPDTRFLYVSNRGHDHLVIYEIEPANGTLALAGYQQTGTRPVNFAVDRKGEFIFVANSSDDYISVFRRDPQTGLLSAAAELASPAPSCLTHLILE